MREGAERALADVSLSNFLEVADEAVVRSDYDRSHLDFVALTHMKRWSYDPLVDRLNAHYYLDEGLSTETVESGDAILFLAAGSGSGVVADPDQQAVIGLIVQ